MEKRAPTSDDLLLGCVGNPPAAAGWVFFLSRFLAKVGLAMPSCRRMPHIAPNVARCRLIEWKGGGFLDAENFGAFFQKLLSSKPWRFGERILHEGQKMAAAY